MIPRQRVSNRREKVVTTPDPAIPANRVLWTAEAREAMCGCGHPEQHTDDRTEQWQ